MLIQLCNIIAGFLLAVPKLKTLGAKVEMEKAENWLNQYRTQIGLAELAVGALALLDRISSAIFIPWFGSSFPQALVALAIGAIISARFFTTWPAVSEYIRKLEKYAEWVGIAGIVITIVSIF